MHYVITIGSIPFRLYFESLPDVFRFFFDHKYLFMFTESQASELEFLYGEIYSVVNVNGSITTEFFHCYKFSTADSLFILNNELPF